MNTAEKVLARYIQAARVLPLVIDKERLHKWIEGLTGKVITKSFLAGQGKIFKLSAIFADGAQINYEISFDFSLRPAGIEMVPVIRPISPIAAIQVGRRADDLGEAAKTAQEHAAAAMAHQTAMKEFRSAGNRFKEQYHEGKMNHHADILREMKDPSHWSED